MKRLNLLGMAVLALLTGLSMQSCKEEVDFSNADDHYRIEPSAQVPLGPYTLTWSQMEQNHYENSTPGTTVAPYGDYDFALTVTVPLSLDWISEGTIHFRGKNYIPLNAAVTFEFEGGVPENISAEPIDVKAATYSFETGAQTATDIPEVIIKLKNLENSPLTDVTAMRFTIHYSRVEAAEYGNVLPQDNFAVVLNGYIEGRGFYEGDKDSDDK